MASRLELQNQLDALAKEYKEISPEASAILETLAACIGRNFEVKLYQVLATVIIKMEEQVEAFETKKEQT